MHDIYFTKSFSWPHPFQRILPSDIVYRVQFYQKGETYEGFACNVKTKHYVITRYFYS